VPVRTWNLISNGPSCHAQESTKDVQLLRQAARKGAHSGVTVYDYEYELDSTRGRKRILSTVAIAHRKLYIVNGTAKCEGDSCGGAAAETAALMVQAADSFDAL
jgi:PsbP